MINGTDEPCKSFALFAVPAPAIKNIKKNVEAAHTAKLKEEQAAKSKKGKGKGASLKMGTDKVAVTTQINLTMHSNIRSGYASHFLSPSKSQFNFIECACAVAGSVFE